PHDLRVRRCGGLADPKLHPKIQARIRGLYKGKESPGVSTFGAGSRSLMANITIDGKPYTVKDGITIIEAIDQAKIPLPRYCYHPGLSIAGNCRICQVEVKNMPRTVIACNTRV